MKINKTILTTLILLLILFFGCKKNNILTSSIYDINISADTVLFDTLFTTIGSTTKRIKCYNKNNGIINISQVNLQNGENSPFRINVDGESGVIFKNLLRELFTCFLKKIERFLCRVLCKGRCRGARRAP